jgi:hypothetical protein
MAQPLDGGYDPGRDYSDRPVSIHFRKSSQSPVVLDNRRGEGHISAHALLENLFRVIGSLDQRCTFYIAESIPLGRMHVHVVDGLADRTIPAPRNAPQ